MFRRITIKNYRCFRDFTIESMNRVNLVTGKNDTGKTALLEAIYFLLGETNLSLVMNANAFRGFAVLQGDMPALSEWILTHLFREFNVDLQIEIAAKWEEESIRRLRLTYVPRTALEVPIDGQKKEKVTGDVKRGTANILEIEYLFRRESRKATLFVDEKGIRVQPAPPSPEIPGYFLASRIVAPHMEDAQNYSKLQVEKHPFDLVQSLQIIEPRLKRLETIASPIGTVLYADIGLERMLPLGLLGDGLARFTSILVKISTAPHGVVLVDDIDSGIHHSVLPKFWSAIGHAARRFDTQIIATTHSWDCIRAAHTAFVESPTYDFCLHRLERADDDIQVVSYTKRTLGTSLEMNLEVR